MVPIECYCNGQHSVLQIFENFIISICVICGGAHKSQHSYGGEWTTLWNQFSPSFTWVLGFELRSLGFHSGCIYLQGTSLAKTALSLNTPAMILGNEALLI